MKLIALFAFAMSFGFSALAQTAEPKKKALNCEILKLQPEANKKYGADEGPKILEHDSGLYEIPEGTNLLTLELTQKFIFLTDKSADVTVKVKDGLIQLVKVGHGEAAASGVTPTAGTARVVLTDRSSGTLYDVSCGIVESED